MPWASVTPRPVLSSGDIQSMLPPEADDTLDAGETACGELILLIFQQMKTLHPQQVLHVVAYDRGAAEDIPAWCRMTQNTLLYQSIPKDSSQSSHFYIQKKGE